MYQSSKFRLIRLFLLSALVSLIPFSSASAQKVGDRVQCSPYGIATQWFPGTIVKQEGADFLVRLDPREGYSSPEEYIVSKRFIKPGAPGAPPPAPAKPDNQAPPAVPGAGGVNPGGIGIGAANPPNAPVQPQAEVSGAFKVGDRVKVSRNFIKDEKYWETAVITKVVPGSGFEVRTDGKGATTQGDWFIVRPEWMKHDASTTPQAAEPGPFPVNTRPIPKAQKTYTAADCQPNEAKYKEMIEDWKRYSFGIDYDQVDVLWDRFQIGGTTTVFDPYNHAQFSNARDVTANYRVRAIRRYTQQGRTFVKTIVYQYKQHVYFYVDTRGNCVFQNKDGSMGELLYDQTKEVALKDYAALRKIAYKKPTWLRCACASETNG